MIALREHMATDEIVLPATTPETEWVRGRALRKVSPTRDHSRLQTELASALNEWSRGRGEVGTEWRFRIGPPGEPLRPLVPDIAFVELARMRGRTHEELQSPTFAPTVAIEILSPGDDSRDVADKIDTYLRAGCALAIVVDPRAKSMTLHDAAGSTLLTESHVLRHAALPSFEISLSALFAIALNLPS
jgi:Uma2 family endonuclease